MTNVRFREPSRLAATVGGLAGALLLVAGACGTVGAHNDGAADAGGGGSGGSGGNAGSGDAGGAGGGGNTDAAADRSGDAPDGGACGMPASCAALFACDPAMPSGNYMIFPDGPTDAGPVTVHCDMNIGGGGWTVIFLANAINLNSTSIDYTVTSQRLRNNATEALIAFRDLNSNMLASDWASFGLPATWRTQSPLTVAPFEDLTVTATVNGAAPALAMLRYGTQNFGSACSDAWSTVANDNYGRVCLQGTQAAFFSGFTVPTADYCSLSNQAYSTRACSDTARFSIAVR